MDTKNVNFSTGTPVEFWKYLVINKFDNLNEAWELYSKQKHQGVESVLNIVHARTETLFYMLMPYLERKLQPDEYKEIMRTLFDIEPTEKQLRKIFFIVSKQLDFDRITRMDTKSVYDATSVEQENAEYGL